MQVNKTRTYVKVSDEQRRLVIDFMLQNENPSMRSASNFLDIKYDSVRTIWNSYKDSQGQR